ncbi:MAG: acyl carrier protein [Chloroflexota bacterium]
MIISKGLTKFITAELLVDYEENDLMEDDDLLTTGLIDSLGIMRLVTFIEETFEKKIPYEDITIENFRSVKTMANYLQQ